MTQPKRPSRRDVDVDPSDPMFFEDAPLVGTSKILESPNVIEPETFKSVPIPSVYKDGRGENQNLRIGYKRMNLLLTKKGGMRSGYVHPLTQCVFIVDGSMEVWVPRKDGTTEKKTYGPKEYIEIPAYTPHAFHFFEDTIHVDWWGRDKEDKPPEGRNEPVLKHWYYAPYRRMVDSSWGWDPSSGSRGKRILYREVTEDEDDDAELLDKERTDRNFLLVSAAIGILGFALGVSFGQTKR